MRGGARMPSGADTSLHVDGSAGDQDRLHAFVDASQRDIAVRARLRRNELRAAAVDAATFIGSVCDLAERQANVVVTIVSGCHMRGRVTEAAHDFLLLQADDGRHSAIRYRCVAGICEATVWYVAVTGHRNASRDCDMRELLHLLCEQRDDVRIDRADGAVVHGALVGVGDDVVTLGNRPQRQIIPLSAIDAITWQADRAW